MPAAIRLKMVWRLADRASGARAGTALRNSLPQRWLRTGCLFTASALRPLARLLRGEPQIGDSRTGEFRRFSSPQRAMRAVRASWVRRTEAGSPSRPAYRSDDNVLQRRPRGRTAVVQGTTAFGWLLACCASVTAAVLGTEVQPAVVVVAAEVPGLGARRTERTALRLV